VDLRRDLQAAMVARRRGTLTLREWLSWVRGPKAHAIWSRRDPAPFVVDVTRAVGTGARLVGRRRPDTSRTLDGQRRTTVAPPIEEGVSA
jgi:hypothetical protein